MFKGIVEDIVLKKVLYQLHALDEAIFYWLFEKTSALRKTRLAFWFSRSGDGPYYALFAILVAVATVEGSGLFVKRLVYAFTLEVPLFILLKQILRRTRPSLRPKYSPIITPADKFSFPSGHSTAAFLFAILVITSFPVWTSAVYLWAVLVAVSRVALGVHYPSDVIAGAALGTGIGLFFIVLITA